MPTYLTPDNHIIRAPYGNEGGDPSQPGGQMSGTKRLREALMSALITETAKMPAQFFMRNMPLGPVEQSDLDWRKAQIANMPSAEERAADVAHKKALTAAAEAQAKNRVDENDPTTQATNLVVSQEIGQGNIRGAKDIATGKTPVGAAGSVVDAARERTLAGARAAIEEARQGYENSATSESAITNLQQRIGQMMQQIRADHPGDAGERLAREIGEEANQFMYGLRPYDDKLRAVLVKKLLENKEGQFGKGQAGVSEGAVSRSLRPLLDKATGVGTRRFGSVYGN